MFSNASTVIQLLNSSAYTDLDRCSNIGGVFLSEASQCLSLDSTISLPPPPPPSEEEPPTSVSYCLIIKDILRSCCF